MRLSIVTLALAIWLCAGSAAAMAASPAATATPAPPTPGPTPVPSATPPASDPAALAIMRQSEEAMNRLTTLQVSEQVLYRRSRVPGPMQQSELSFAAPDRFHLRVDPPDPSPRETIVIGWAFWERYRDEPWQSIRLEQPFRWPVYPLSKKPLQINAESPESVRILRSERVDGSLAWVIAYRVTVLSIEGPFHESHLEWVTQDTHRLLRTEYTNDDPWGSDPWVVYRYHDFDVPVAIQPPPGFGLPFPDPIVRILLPLVRH